MMPPQGAHSLKIISSLKPALKSKKKKSESTAAEIIDITKPESGDKNIELGDFIPVVELDKINSTGRRKNTRHSWTDSSNLCAR